MLASDEDILKAAEEWRQKGRGVAIATVVETWGSAPRPVGSNLVIDEEGNFLGSVSGGCVEGAVVTEALDEAEGVRDKEDGLVASTELGELVEALMGESLVPDSQHLVDDGF